MIDLVDRVAEELEGLGFDGVSLRRLDQMTGSEGIVVRHMPETVVESYYDGLRILDCPVQIVVRMRSEADAMQTCGDVAQALEGLCVASGNGSYLLDGSSGMQVYTRPQELALEEKNFYAWQVRMSCRVRVI